MDTSHGHTHQIKTHTLINFFIDLRYFCGMASIESIYSVTTSVYSDEDDEEEDDSPFDKLPEYQQQIEQIT